MNARIPDSSVLVCPVSGYTKEQVVGQLNKFDIRMRDWILKILMSLQCEFGCEPAVGEFRIGTQGELFDGQEMPKVRYADSNPYRLRNEFLARYGFEKCHATDVFFAIQQYVQAWEKGMAGEIVIAVMDPVIDDFGAGNSFTIDVRQESKWDDPFLARSAGKFRVHATPWIVQNPETRYLVRVKR